MPICSVSMENLPTGILPILTTIKQVLSTGMLPILNSMMQGLLGQSVLSLPEMKWRVKMMIVMMELSLRLTDSGKLGTWSKEIS